MLASVAKLQEIEGNENDLRVVTAMPQLVKARHPTLVAAHRVAVDRAAAYLQSLETMPSTRSGRRVTGARCTIVWPPQLPFGRLIARFIYWMCELSHTSPAPAGARHDDACGQGDVSDDERVCRVRARHDFRNASAPGLRGPGARGSVLAGLRQLLRWRNESVRLWRLLGGLAYGSLPSGSASIHRQCSASAALSTAQAPP